MDDLSENFRGFSRIRPMSLRIHEDVGEFRGHRIVEDYEHLERHVRPKRVYNDFNINLLEAQHAQRSA